MIGNLYGILIKQRMPKGLGITSIILVCKACENNINKTSLDCFELATHELTNDFCPNVVGLLKSIRGEGKEDIAHFDLIIVDILDGYMVHGLLVESIPSWNTRIMSD
jgi:hypothetical protein